MRWLTAILLFLTLSAQAQDKVQQIDKLVEQYVKDGSFTGAVIVAENGTTTYAKGFGLADASKGLANGPDVKYRIASISKTFAATIVMKLVDDGKIDLNAPITTYLPTYRKETGDKVTIQNLLSHTSGIPNYTDNAEWRMHATEPVTSLDSFIEKYCSGDLEFTPGSKFSYSNSGFFLLGAIIQKVTGMPYAQALKTMILDPAGMTNSGLETDDSQLTNRALGYAGGFSADGTPAQNWSMSGAFAAGGMYSTPEDMLKWDKALHDQSFIKQTLTSRMFHPFLADPKGGYGGYGFGFVVRTKSLNNEGDNIVVIGHSGGIPGFTSLFSRVPAKKQVVFVVSNHNDQSVNAITDKILSVLNGADPGIVQKSLAMEVYKSIKKDGLQAGMQLFDKEKNSPAYDVSEADFNILGYTFLGEKQYPEAVSVFSLNAGRFPTSWNVYDSLAECYMKMGEKEKAIKYYTKSVTMNPKNTGGIEALKTLGAVVPTSSN